MSSKKKKKKKQPLLMPRHDTYYIDAIGPKNNECKISLPVPTDKEMSLLFGEGWYE